jgi:hypothetical protein
MRVIRVHDEFLIRASDMSSEPNRERIKNLSNAVTRVEFKVFQCVFNQMEAAGIPNYRDHHTFRLLCVAPFQESLRPDEARSAHAPH